MTTAEPGAVPGFSSWREEPPPEDPPPEGTTRTGLAPAEAASSRAAARTNGLMGASIFGNNRKGKGALKTPAPAERDRNHVQPARRLHQSEVLAGGGGAVLPVEDPRP